MPAVFRKPLQKETKTVRLFSSHCDKVSKIASDLGVSDSDVIRLIHAVFFGEISDDFINLKLKEKRILEGTDQVA